MSHWPNQRIRIPLQNAPNGTQKTSPRWKEKEKRVKSVLIAKIPRSRMDISEQKKVGIGLIGFGIFFTLLGVVLFFDRGLLALGNIIYLSGNELQGLFVLSSGTLSHICSLAYSRYCFRNIWVNCSLQWFLAFRQGFPISDSSCGVDCALFLVTDYRSLLEGFL
ncbi:hypothetical protein MRB53_004405 [Persea americana]|uniref:Uncharacterized protein n=1 Tax=Persea americana TaxID=3435 RepID=A0ACC2MA43_PERAE|nr:hypothetical protein MRB53_004405 [Persea americana]